jgi:NAD(P)-dependent dehydrogenase (short-subunit alcohol dehydrogenase family)
MAGARAIHTVAGMTTTAPTAVVTGASRGLGLALARSLAQDGWALVVDARDAGDLADAVGPLEALTTVIPVVGDVTDEAHRDDLAAAAQALGGVDLLVLNAGTLGPSPLPALAALRLGDLRATLEANLVAQLGVVQALLPHLRTGATLVAVTSDAAVEPYEGWGAYGAAKAGFEQLAAVLAAERPELRVLRIDPGDMRTQMHQDAFPGEDISDRPTPEERVPGVRGLIEGPFPSGRYQAGDVPAPLEVG